MAHGAGQTGNTAIHETLKDYCLRVIRFVSRSALDPHLYFERKLVGDVSVAESIKQLLDILTGLLDWIDETTTDVSHLSGFDKELSHSGLPSLSLLCAPETRSAGLVLACNGIRTPTEHRLVQELIKNVTLKDADRSIAERLLAENERD